MFCKNQRRSKSRSLIATGVITPMEWDISLEEAAQALKNKGVGVREVKKVSSLKHQVCISYWNSEGKLCCSFFSYRIFERWQKAVESAIKNCQTIEECDRIGDSIEYELVKFSYLPGLGNRIWDAWKNRRRQFKEAETECKLNRGRLLRFSAKAQQST